MRSLLPLFTLFAFTSLSQAQPIENNEMQGALCWESPTCGLNHKPLEKSNIKVDSTLLPLIITKTTYSQYYSNNFPSLITAIKENLMLGDSAGNMHFLKEDIFSETGFPRIQKKHVSVKDLKYIDKYDSLFACFQYVDDADNSQHTAIGQLKFKKNIKSDSLRWDFLFDSNHKKVLPNNCAMDVSDSKIYFIIGTVNEGEINNPIAQNKDNTLGKSYALDIASRKVELLTLGHRVSLGMVARQNGQIWFTENGERGGDKLSYIIRNKNYGWPLKVSGTRYLQFTSSNNPRETQNSQVDLNSYVDPVYAWLPSIAPSALIEIHDFNPAWDGDLLMGSLKAQSLYRIRLKDNHVHSIEQIYIGQRIRGIKQIKKEILLTTDEGALVTLSVDSERLKINSALPGIPGGHQLLYCVNCHSISSADVTAGFGPSLRGVYGRQIAAQNFPYFSDSLKKVIGIWDEAKLTSFLLDPSSFAPGTTMNLGINLSNDDVKKIVEVLKTLK